MISQTRRIEKWVKGQCKVCMVIVIIIVINDDVKILDVLSSCFQLGKKSYVIVMLVDL